MTDYNWSAINDEDMAKLIRSEVAIRGNHSFFDALLLEEVRRIESRIAAIAAAVQAEREAQQPLVDALNKIVELIETSEPTSTHPGTGEIIGRRPRAQQIIDVARAAIRARNEAAR